MKMMEDFFMAAFVLAAVVAPSASGMAVEAPLKERMWWKQWSYNCSKTHLDWDADYTDCRDIAITSGMYNRIQQRSPINIDTFGDGFQTFKNFGVAPYPLEIQSFLRHADTFTLMNGLLPEVAPRITDPVPQYIKLRHDNIQDELTTQKSYLLERIVLHHPSEHTIDHQRYPLETQLYMAECERDDCVGRKLKEPRKALALAVMGIVTEDELVKPLLKDFAKSLGETADAERLLTGGFNPNLFMPEYSGFFKYEGSETAPPCEPEMTWVVMQHAVNVTQELIDSVKERIHQFHPESYGNARPLQVQFEEDLSARPPVKGTRIDYHENKGEILTPMSVPSLTETQAHQKAYHNTLFAVDLLQGDPAYWHHDRYVTMDKGGCNPVPVADVEYGIEPNTPPDILRLRPDISVQEQGATISAKSLDELDKDRTPFYSKLGTTGGGVPTTRMAMWTKGLSDQADLVKRELMCRQWASNGKPSADPNAEFCRLMLPMLPLGGTVYGNYPMPAPSKPPPKVKTDSIHVYPPPGEEGYPVGNDEINPYRKDYTFDQEKEMEMNRIGQQISERYDMIAHDGFLRRFIPDQLTPVYGKKGNAATLKKTHTLDTPIETPET